MQSLSIFLFLLAKIFVFKDRRNVYLIFFILGGIALFGYQIIIGDILSAMFNLIMIIIDIFALSSYMFKSKNEM